MSATLELTPQESVQVREATDEALVVEGRWRPHAAAPPRHFHPDQDERFEMLEGILVVRVDGTQHELRPGETLVVPRGAVHQMWNPAGEPARALWRTSPPGRTRDWFADLDALRRSGRVGRNGMPSPLAFGVLLTEYRDVIRLAGPQPVVLAGLRLLGAVGRRRGYRPGSGRAHTGAAS